MNFHSFLEESLEELQFKNELLGDTLLRELGNYAWEYDLNEKTIGFTSESGETIQFKCIPVGSYNNQKSTWLWAWANQSIPNYMDLVQCVSKLAEHFPDEQHLIDANSFETSEFYGQEISAALIKEYKSIGMWKADSDEGVITTYFVLDSLNLDNRVYRKILDRLTEVNLR